MKRKGFTLVELLVVIAIIALLMGILMPALARVRQLAFRMVCGTNLSGIGKAMLIYANDYEDELPRAGGRTNTWVGALPGTGAAAGWMAGTRKQAFEISGNAGKTTVSASFYLLVKYAEVTPKQFVCKGETDTTEFKLSEFADIIPSNFQLIDAWDFGPFVSADDNPTRHCSYSYHWPFDQYALTTGSDPSMAVAADRNPWLTSNRGDNAEYDFADFIPDDEQHNGTSESAKVGNSDAHQGDGQNVLFVDSHVQFEKRSFCGLEDDNIYTRANDTAFAKHTKGVQPIALQQLKPITREDSYLIQDPGTNSRPR